MMDISFEQAHNIWVRQKKSPRVLYFPPEAATSDTLNPQHDAGISIQELGSLPMVE